MNIYWRYENVWMYKYVMYRYYIYDIYVSPQLNVHSQCDLWLFFSDVTLLSIDIWFWLHNEIWRDWELVETA